MQYKIVKNYLGEVGAIREMTANVFIPLDPMNTDYQLYLKWVSEGNTPFPADAQG